MLVDAAGSAAEPFLFVSVHVTDLAAVRLRDNKTSGTLRQPHYGAQQCRAMSSRPE